MPTGKCGPIGFASTPNIQQAASRPCSLEVAASAGKPMTSPAAKMWGTAVR